ncbi:hypothetical protein [Falsirhodobacter algicola]|uniref:DUF2946 domain-containing protein n=1 Tax=Falsirhodobacter algicola TaxID=2692330 RepID=A0A8J8MVH8_9RHOB|nr:hypothetical protein [Falsirhodobacter algicola]QUS37284.1 hypothetical protein GR316_12945 [Falsirhodobacter algicola]
MRDRSFQFLPGLVLLMLLSVAFAAGTALRAAPSASEVRLEAWLLEGNTRADLCNHDGPDHVHTATCSLCHLLASGDLPARIPALIPTERHIAATVILPRTQRAFGRARDPAVPPRGPPALT